MQNGARQKESIVSKKKCAETIHDYCRVIRRVDERYVDISAWQYGPAIARTEEEAQMLGVVASMGTWFAMSREGRKHGLSIDDLGQPCFGNIHGTSALAQCLRIPDILVGLLSTLFSKLRERHAVKYIDLATSAGEFIIGNYEAFTSDSVNEFSDAFGDLCDACTAVAERGITKDGNILRLI